MAGKTVRNKLTTAGSADVYRPSAEEKRRQQQWQAEEDIRTLQKAREIREDKARIARAKAMACKQAAELKKIK